jgi:hypothetical protein
MWNSTLYASARERGRICRRQIADRGLPDDVRIRAGAPGVELVTHATILPLAISALGLLCIAVAFQRLNMWRQNAGATYEWVCRSLSPYAGNLVGWLMLVAFCGFVLIDVITIGPSVLALLGFSPNNQFVGALAIVIIGTALTATAVIGIRPYRHFIKRSPKDFGILGPRHGACAGPRR